MQNAERIRKTGGIILAGLLLLIIALNFRNLSLNVWSGSIATGLCFALVAMGVYITFRILDFPDLTIDGSFPLGASIAAAMIAAGTTPISPCRWPLPAERWQAPPPL